MDSFLDITLPLSIVALAYTTYLSCAPPNAPRSTSATADVIETRFKITTLMRFYQIWALFFGAYHALLCIFPPFTLQAGSALLPWTERFSFHTFSLYDSLSSLEVRQRINHSRLAPFCPHTESLNPTLFAWSPYLVFSISVGIASGLARIHAYRTLGGNFTLQLKEPERLVQTGLYSYARHPSYTFWIANWFACIAVLGRADGVTVRSLSKAR